MTGLPRHLGDGHARRLGIGQVRPANDEAILKRDRLADRVEGSLPLALCVDHCPGPQLDLRLQRGVGGQDLALGLVQARGVQRPGERGGHLRAPATEALAVGVAEGRAAGAADRLEDAHQLARADQGNRQHRSRIGAVAPRAASRQGPGSSPSPRLTGAASAAQVPASSSPMGIEAGGAGRAGSAAPSTRVVSSPMRQQMHPVRLHQPADPAHRFPGNLLGGRGAGAAPAPRRRSARPRPGAARWWARPGGWASSSPRPERASPRRRGMSSARWTARTPDGSARGTGPSGTWSTAVAPAVTTRESSSRQKGTGWTTTASATAEDRSPSTSSGAHGLGSRPPLRSASSSAGEGVSGPTTRTGRVASIGVTGVSQPRRRRPRTAPRCRRGGPTRSRPAGSCSSG